MTIHTCFVVALPAEAKSVVQRYHLKRQHDITAFEIYRHDEVSLIICGVGKINAAAATAFLGSMIPAGKNHLWINYGIAGHEVFPLGKLLIGEKITDVSTQESWYPPLINLKNIAGSQITTVEIPQTHYPKNSLVEMEASGFIPTARRFSSSELVHCIKVVSDNKQQSTIQINAERIKQICSENLGELENIITHIRRLADQLDSLEISQTLLTRYQSRWHFSVTQTHQLKLLLQRWRALDDQSEYWIQAFEEQNDSKALMQSLRRHLNALPVKLKPTVSKVIDT